MIFKTKPFPHQQECFDRFKDSEYIALFSSPGTGKTKMAIDIAAHKYNLSKHNRMVVVAPAAVHSQWVDEQFPEHCPVPWKGYSFKPDNLMRDIRERDKFMMECRTTDELRVFTLNYESFIRGTGYELLDQFVGSSSLPPIIALDEASRIKNPDAKTTMMLIGLLARYPASWRTVITGTPAAKSPVDLWSIMNFLRDNYMGCCYQAFKHEHVIQVDKKMKVKNRLITVRGTIDDLTHTKIRRMIKKNTQDGKISDIAVNYIKDQNGLNQKDYEAVRDNDEVVRFKNLDKLQKKIAPDTFSVDKKDCLELPDKIYQEIKFKLNLEQCKLIKQLSKYAVAEHEGEHLTVSQKALLGTRVLQICGGFFAHHTATEGEYSTIPIKGKNAKLNFIKADIDDIDGQQFIIWSAFTPEFPMLFKALKAKCSCAMLYGDTPKHNRPQIVDDFKRGKIRGLIANPTVAGYGLNLQGAGIQYYYSRDYRTEARIQAEDRSHRIGTIRAPIYKDLLYDIPFEMMVLATLKEGKELNSKFVTLKIGEIFAM